MPNPSMPSVIESSDRHIFLEFSSVAEAKQQAFFFAYCYIPRDEEKEFIKGFAWKKCYFWPGESVRGAALGMAVLGVKGSGVVGSVTWHFIVMKNEKYIYI